MHYEYACMQHAHVYICTRLSICLSHTHSIVRVHITHTQKHYYQPMWTLVGAGAKTLDQSCRSMAELIPPQAVWHKTSVTEFYPEGNYIITADGKKIGYDYLIVALGLQLNFDKVKM